MWSRTVTMTGRSKRWWKREWKTKRTAARKDKKARKVWHKEIKRQKRICGNNG